VIGLRACYQDVAAVEIAMRKIDGTIIRQILAERLDWDRIWIEHWFSI
jgi:hypothetical protein